jgi:16S rRNA (uracil1498-N3)-methyltransferase
MPHTRLFSPRPLTANTVDSLDEAQSRYLSRTLRLRNGDELTLFDGRGGEFPAVITRLKKNAIEVEIGSHVDRDAESRLYCRLLQGVSRGDRMDTVVQKSTELGAARITPLFTDYSVVRLDEARARKRQQHWQKIAQSACEQCGRNRVPQIDVPQRLADWLANDTSMPGARVILRPGDAPPLASLDLSDASVSLLIGPEGGFSETEYDNASAGGFREASFGPRVLRTETAAVAALAVCQALWGDARATLPSSTGRSAADD